MKIVQEIELPENCINCIARAEAAREPFYCGALAVKAELEGVNATATGLQELEKTRKDLATPILQRMLGVAVAKSLSTWSPKNIDIASVESKMSDCAGPVIWEIGGVKGKTSSLAFHYNSHFYLPKDTNTGNEPIVVSTELLNPEKFSEHTYPDGRTVLKGINGISGLGSNQDVDRIKANASLILKAAQQ